MLGFGVVLDAGGSYRQTVLIGVEGALSRYIIVAGYNCFLALISDVNLRLLMTFTVRSARAATDHLSLGWSRYSMPNGPLYINYSSTKATTFSTK